MPGEGKGCGEKEKMNKKERKERGGSEEEIVFPDPDSKQAARKGSANCQRGSRRQKNRGRTFEAGEEKHPLKRQGEYENCAKNRSHLIRFLGHDSDRWGKDVRKGQKLQAA